MGINASSALFRFTILLMTCFLSFGPMFCFDMPGALQAQFLTNFRCFVVSGNDTNDANASSTSACCSDCLGMDPDDYNMLYATFSWTSAVVALGAGFLLDSLGNRVGMLVFSALCAVGTCIFAVGPYYAETSYFLPMMIFGRLLLGAGGGAMGVVQNRMTAIWFEGKELALAFGILIALYRVGSVTNFLVTGTLYSTFGLQWTLWAGALLCATGFLLACFLSCLEHAGMKQLGTTGTTTGKKAPKFQDLRHLSPSFWLLTIANTLLFSSTTGFVSNANKYIQDKYQIDYKIASYLVGVVYVVPMVLSPVVGRVLDKVGYRGLLLAIFSSLMAPMYVLFAFTNIHPAICTVWLGAVQSVCSVATFSSVPLVVPQGTMGAANGVFMSIMMTGIGISNLVIGKILGKNKPSESLVDLSQWVHIMYFLISLSVAFCLIAITLYAVDKFKQGLLNLNKKALLDRSQATEKTETVTEKDATP